MRNLLLAISAMLFLSGCDLYYITKGDLGYPRWQVGECAQEKQRRPIESWEKEEAYVYRILEIGKRAYFVRVYRKVDGKFKIENSIKFVNNELVVEKQLYSFDMSHRFSSIDMGTFKTECPSELNN